jgi:hypothetical protein
VNSGLSYAYSAGLFSDGGEQFNVQIVPEPSSKGLVAVGILGLALAGSWKFRKLAFA